MRFLAFPAFIIQLCNNHPLNHFIMATNGGEVSIFASGFQQQGSTQDICQMQGK